jgi:hypothetical protein
VGPSEVLELVIQEFPPSTLTNIDDDPLGGAGAGDPRASTINAKKYRRRDPWEVSELEIRERPPPTLKLSTVGPLGVLEL